MNHAYDHCRVGIGSISLVCAQGMEQEPNDTCPVPHNLGTLTLPLALNESLDATCTLVELRSCSALTCSSVNYQHTDPEGRFRSETDVQGQRLLAGMY